MKQSINRTLFYRKKKENQKNKSDTETQEERTARLNSYKENYVVNGLNPGVSVIVLDV